MAGPPIFVLGHWRSGTTLLHELITLDPRFAFPSHYDCFQSGHFLLTGPLVHWVSRFSNPLKRPMDDMKVTLTFPGEDEAALRNSGVASFYNGLILPSRAEEDQAGVDLQALPPSGLQLWKKEFQRFIRELNFRYRRPLVLKSPTHTARVHVLLDLYPDARFVNIVRDPREVHPSTVKTWQALTNLMSLEADARIPEARLLSVHRTLHENLKSARPLVPRGQFCEARFEDLTADPVAEMGRVYSELGLGGFEEVKPRIEAYFESRSEVRAASYPLSPEQRSKIESELADVISDNGYGPPSSD